MRGKDGEMIRLVGGATRLLDEDAAAAELRQALGPEYQLLRWSLSRGCELLNAVAMTEPAGAMEDATVCLLWLYLEALDGADVLLKAGAIGPAEIVARTVIEDGLQLLYLLRRDDPRLARAYNAERVRRNAGGFEKLAHGSDQKRELIAEAKRSWPRSVGVWRRHRDTSQDAQRLRGTLREGDYADVDDELDRLGPNAAWYAAFGGPRDLLGVARYLGMDLWHRMIYATWSDRVHGRASHTVYVLQPDGDVPLNVLRNTSEWATVATHLHLMNTRVFEAVNQRYQAETAEAFARWKAWIDSRAVACFTRNGFSGQGDTQTAAEPPSAAPG